MESLSVRFRENARTCPKWVSKLIAKMKIKFQFRTRAARCYPTSDSEYSDLKQCIVFGEFNVNSKTKFKLHLSVLTKRIYLMQSLTHFTKKLEMDLKADTIKPNKRNKQKS